MHDKKELHRKRQKTICVKVSYQNNLILITYVSESMCNNFDILSFFIYLFLSSHTDTQTQKFAKTEICTVYGCDNLFIKWKK